MNETVTFWPFVEETVLHINVVEMKDYMSYLFAWMCSSVNATKCQNTHLVLFKEFLF